MAVVGPLDETDLRDEPRFHPRHLAHLLRGDASAPVRRLAVGQVDERTLRRAQRLQAFEHLAPEMRRKSCAHLSRESQLAVFVVADEQRIDAIRSRPEAADYQFLLLVSFQLHPPAGALAPL